MLLLSDDEWAAYSDDTASPEDDPVLQQWEREIREAWA